MKKSKKILSLLCLATATAGVIHAINKTIATIADSLNALPTENSHIYNWRFGDIYYTVVGSGSPLFLVHDLSPISSSTEWTSLIKEYSKSHTVYAIDLLGCGRSDKPAITYTNFIYVQLISDFVREVIGSRTNVIATGMSCTFVSMACYSDNSLFDKIIFSNPPAIAECSTSPNKNSKFVKALIEMPIIGTLLYNICFNRTNVEKSIRIGSFCNYFDANSKYIEGCYQAAHIGGSSKFLFASIMSHYVNINICRAIKNIDNSILIIHGKPDDDTEVAVEGYKSMNSAIESKYIKNTKSLSHVECPNEFYKTTSLFL